MYDLRDQIPGFKVGDRVRVTKGTSVPVGLTGTVFKVQYDLKFGKHRLMLTETNVPNPTGQNRARPYAANCEVI